jgi:hypothetical protein
MNLGITKLGLHLDGGLRGAHVGQSFATGNCNFVAFVKAQVQEGGLLLVLLDGSQVLHHGGPVGELK